MTSPAHGTLHPSAGASKTAEKTKNPPSTSEYALFDAPAAGSNFTPAPRRHPQRRGGHSVANDPQAGLFPDPRYTGKKFRAGSLAAWIVGHAPVSASVPVVSRRRWIQLVNEWISTTAGQEALAQESVTPRRFHAAAHAMAIHAHCSTGRNIAVTNKRLARECGYSETTITTVRRILLKAGWLHKSGDGCSSRTGRFNRPTIVHLTTPRPAETVETQPVDNSLAAKATTAAVCDLLSSSHVLEKSPVRRNLKARRRAHSDSRPPKTSHERRRWAVAYRLADDLISRTVGLSHARGPVTAALMFSSLDLETWSGIELKTALDVSGRHEHRWDWPTKIDRPGAFLASRLRHLQARPQVTAIPPIYKPEPTAAPAAPHVRHQARESLKALFEKIGQKSQNMRSASIFQPRGRTFSYA